MHHLGRSFVPTGLRHLLPRSPKRVLVVGGGPCGLWCADRLRHHFEVTVVDSKEYFEYTPGILRAVADPSHHSRITFKYREVLEGNLGVEFVHGEASDVQAPSSGQGPGSVLVKPVGSVSGNQSRLHFDYCVVAVGVSNGIWKPRTIGEPSGPAVGSSMSVGAPAAMPAVQDRDERSLEVRREALSYLRESIASARAVHIVGAGLVGVELAAELAHFYPRLKVRLVDGAPVVLPQLAEGAREYARQVLQQQNVSLDLGTPFAPESVGEGELVLWCVGTRPRSTGLFADGAAVLKPNGQVRVNPRMQVLRKTGAGGPAELEPIGQGRVFAVGDAAAVEGVPTAQIIFHGEEMAAVAVQNIEASEDISSPLALSKDRRELEAGQQLLCCTSLGPQDGMFSTQSELLATGAFSAIQKQMIEETKMAALRGEMVGSLLWMPVH